MEALDFNPPLILRQCGCTFCGSCLYGMIDAHYENQANMEAAGSEAVVRKPTCPTCGEEIVEETATECRRNIKIINFLTAEEAQPLVHGGIESIPCPKHPNKIIDYFCKTCSTSVCSKCIYDDHNGHSLMPVEEMSNSLK